MQKIIFVKRGFIYSILFRGGRRRGALDENGLRRQNRKLCATLFKVVQLPRGSRETEVAVLIVFFCGEIIIKEMREHNVLLNFPLGPFFPRSRCCRPSR